MNNVKLLFVAGSTYLRREVHVLPIEVETQKNRYKISNKDSFGNALLDFRVYLNFNELDLFCVAETEKEALSLYLNKLATEKQKLLKQLENTDAKLDQTLALINKL